jgi:zinc transport system substrate-binding protein
MKIPPTRWLVLLTLMTFTFSAKAQNVVATNAWTAAFAEAAGAKNVTVLAPFQMQHPTEYELRPGDIPRVMKADLIIYAGYETMLGRMRKGLHVDESKMLQIDTRYDLPTIRKSIMKIAERLGTTEEAKTNLQQIENTIQQAKKTLIKDGMTTKPVLVHFFQRPLIRELGLKIAGVFGPAPPEARQIADMAKSHAVLIIDNAHNPVGKPLQEVLPGARLVSLLNFPGTHHTQTLMDVIHYDVEQLTRVSSEINSPNHPGPN